MDLVKIVKSFNRLHEISNMKQPSLDERKEEGKIILNLLQQAMLDLHTLAHSARGGGIGYVGPMTGSGGGGSV